MMNTIGTPIPKKQLTTLALFEVLILVLFAVGFLWLDQGVLGNDEGERFLALAPYWVFPYLLVNSVYVGLLAARFAKGRWQQAWLWGIAGFGLTLLFILGLPSLLSSAWPYPSPEIFAGPAIFAFLAPVVSAMLLVLLMSIRKRAPSNR